MPNVTVVIGAEVDTRYEDVVSVLDACAQANLTRVAFQTAGRKAG